MFGAGMAKASATDASLLNDVPISTHYTLRNVIGQGSFGTVYTAERKDDGATVVVKKIHVEALTESERCCALQEARTLSQFNHANIVQYHETRSQGGVRHTMAPISPRRGDVDLLALAHNITGQLASE